MRKRSEVGAGGEGSAGSFSATDTVQVGDETVQYQGVGHPSLPGVDMGDAIQDVMKQAAQPPVNRSNGSTRDFDAIVETIFVKDVIGTYRRLEAALKIGQGHTEHGHLMKAADEAESNARQAHNLWMVAKAEKDRWEADAKQIQAPMYEAASAVLQKEKADGKRSKQITNDDVEAMMVTMYRDEMRHQREKTLRIKTVEASMQHLCEMWASRCRTLNTMLGKSR